MSQLPDEPDNLDSISNELPNAVVYYEEPGGILIERDKEIYPSDL